MKKKLLLLLLGIGLSLAIFSTMAYSQEVYIGGRVYYVTDVLEFGLGETIETPAGQNGIIKMTGVGGTNNTDLVIDLDEATGPEIYSTTDTTIVIDDILDLDNHQIKNVSDPTADQDVVTKKYVVSNYEPVLTNEASLYATLSDVTGFIEDTDDLFLINSGDDSTTGRLTARGFTSGVSDTGYDVTFWGDTAGKYAGWDTSDDKWIVDGATRMGDGTNDVIISNAGALSYSGSAKPTKVIFLRPEDAFLPTTNPATLTTTTGTNHTYQTLDYDPTTAQTACWDFYIPENYDGGDVTIEAGWFSTVTTNEVQFDVETGSFGNSVQYDQALTNTAMTESTADATASDISQITGSLTAPWTAGEWVRFDFIRDAGVAGDDHTGVARLMYVVIKYSVAN